MYRNFKFSVLTLLFVLIIVCCNAQKKTSATTNKMKLSNEWVLTGFFDSNDLLISDSSKSAILAISTDENFFTGNTGCNAMRGGVIAETEGKIKIGPVESMRKRCPNAENEKKFLAALDCVTNYKIDGSILILYCNEKHVLQFECNKN